MPFLTNKQNRSDINKVKETDTTNCCRFKNIHLYRNKTKILTIQMVLAEKIKEKKKEKNRDGHICIPLLVVGI